MTYTEIIAVKLFGWERIEDKPEKILGPPSRWYELGNYSTAVYDNGSAVGWTAGNWPDFTDGSLRWYWIRRMEDALAERGLGKTYAQTLCGAYPELLTPDEFDAIAAPCLRATADQRVAACVKVLEGQG